MGTPLALRVNPQDRETFPSFLSRMAAVNGTSVLKFCSDMGVSYRGLINLNADDLKTFAALSALTEAQIDELVSWTGQAVGDVRMRFRGEVGLPPVKWSSAMFRQTEETHGKQATKA